MTVTSLAATVMPKISSVILKGKKWYIENGILHFALVKLIVRNLVGN